MPVRGDNSLFFATGLDNSGLEQGRLDAIGIVKSLASSISKINPFLGLAVGAATAFAAISAEAFNFAKRYEQAMLEVRTISKAANDDFRGIGNDIFKLSEQTLDDPVKLAQAYYQVVSAGYDGAKGLRVLEVASKAATAGVTDTQTAADGITTVLNAFGESAENANKVADAMFKTVELGKTNFAQLSASLSQAAPLAAALGVSYNEILAAVASLTKQGVPTAQAMTQIRAALIGVNKELGDGWSNAYTFQEAMQEVRDRSGGSTEKLQKMVLSIEAVGAVLATTGKNAENAANDLEALEEASGSAEKAFRIMASGQINQMQILRNRIKAVTEGLGNELLDVANKVAGFFVDLTGGSNFSAELYAKERRELRDLKLELQDGGVAIERKKQIIDELKSKYPAYLENIKNEGKLTSELSMALTDVNDQLLKRFQLEGNKEEASKVALEIAKEEKKQIEAQKNLRAELDRITNADARNIIENYKEQGRSLGDIVDALKNYSKEQFSYLNLYTEAIRKPGRELIDLRNQFKDLTGQIDETNKGIVDFGNAEKTTDEAGAILEDTEKALETYQQYLQRRKKDYEAYEAVRLQIGEEYAQKQFKTLLDEGENYRQFLINQLNETKDFAKQRAIALEATSNQLNLQNTAQEAVKSFNPVEGQLANSTITVPLKFEFDQESADEIEANITKAQNAWGKASDQATRDALDNYIEAQKLKLQSFKRTNEEEIEERKRLQEMVEGFSLRELYIRTRDARKYWKEQKELRGKDSKEALEALAEYRDAQQKLGDEIQGIANQIAGIFNSAGELFEKFGNEEMGDLMSQLAGVAQGIGELGKGIATGDPFAIAKGILDIANAAITVEIVSDTAKFEAAIKKLERSIEQLDYAISQSIGDERIANRQEAIDQLKELEEQAQLAKEAEEKARKEVRFLGLRIGDKGEGSGTNPEKIRELEDQAEEARRKVVELNREIDELFTGTTRDSIVDSILDGFEEGKRGINDFASTFEDLMRQAVLESLKMKYLEKAVQEFFEDFANASESGGALTSREISALRNQFNELINESQAELDALNQILGEAGIASTDRAARQGLSGEIKTVTEETANVLAGAINGIRLDVAAGLNAAREANFYLQNIMISNSAILEQNLLMAQRLLNIEKALA